MRWVKLSARRRWENTRLALSYVEAELTGSGRTVWDIRRKAGYDTVSWKRRAIVAKSYNPIRKYDWAMWPIGGEPQDWQCNVLCLSGVSWRRGR